MKIKHIILIILLCIIWGANVPLSKYAVLKLPPIFFAGIRFFFVALFLSPWLFPKPSQLLLIFFISNLIAGLSFVLLFFAFKYTTASNVAIIDQLTVPLTAIASFTFLNERLDNGTILGIFCAFIGVIIVVYEKNALNFNFGSMLAFIVAIMNAAASILMKKLKPINAIKMQAWIALFSFLQLAFLSLFFERTQIDIILHSDWKIYLIIAFGVLFVSIFAHSSFYYLIKLYDVSIIVSFTIIVPIIAVALSHIILSEIIGIKFLIGSLVCLLGVWLIILSSKKKKMVNP